MHAKTTHRTAAFVLRVLDYGESDRIVTFYTEDFGKLKGIAKGAKRSRRRFANALEPFSCLEILFSRRGRDGLALIEDSTPICHYASLRADLERTLIASYLIDLTDQFTLEGKRQADIYRLLAGFLDLVAQGPALESLWRFFELRLLKLTGYEPVLDRCLACRSLLDPDQSYQFVPRGRRAEMRTLRYSDLRRPPHLDRHHPDPASGQGPGPRKTPPSGRLPPNGPRKSGGPDRLHPSPPGAGPQIHAGCERDPETLHLTGLLSY